MLELTQLANSIAKNKLTEEHGKGGDSDLYRYLKKSFQEEDISLFFKGFNKFFYESAYEFDISGFNLIFFYPPYLSGLNGQLNPDELLSKYFYDFCSFALDVTPPEITVNKSSVGLLGTEVFDFPTHVHSSGDISLTYLDTHDIKLYNFHSIWIKYIHAVILGHIEPKLEYVEKNLIDYMGSIYILKFDADMKTPRVISKALGIYPNLLPTKEYIGNRSQHQVVLSNITYNCAYYYEEYVYDPVTNSNQKLYTEFLSKFEKLFESYTK